MTYSAAPQRAFKTGSVYDRNKGPNIYANGQSQLFIPEKAAGIFDRWLWCLMSTTDKFYQHLAPDSGNVKLACRRQMGGIWVSRRPHLFLLYGSVRRNVLSPSPPTVLPTDNTFPPPICPVSSHFSLLWSPLSSLSSSSKSVFFFNSTSYFQVQNCVCMCARASAASQYGKWELASSLCVDRKD